jgi:hypothetical protein
MALNIHSTVKARTVPNIHGSAEAACDVWLKGAVWGNPIHLSPSKIQIYGVYRRDWSILKIEFTNDKITVISVKEQKQST